MRKYLEKKVAWHNQIWLDLVEDKVHNNIYRFVFIKMFARL